MLLSHQWLCCICKVNYQLQLLFVFFGSAMFSLRAICLCTSTTSPHFFFSTKAHSCGAPTPHSSSLLLVDYCDCAEVYGDLSSLPALHRPRRLQAAPLHLAPVESDVSAKWLFCLSPLSRNSSFQLKLNWKCPHLFPAPSTSTNGAPMMPQMRPPLGACPTCSNKAASNDWSGGVDRSHGVITCSSVYWSFFPR